MMKQVFVMIFLWKMGMSVVSAKGTVKPSAHLKFRFNEITFARRSVVWS